MTRATPLYFPDTLQFSSACKDLAGTKSRLFGWLHDPSPDADLNTGIILCDSVGHSDTRYLHRKLAEELTASGFTTLRFDYYGTGNSSGADDEPGLVASWIDGINAAVDSLTSMRDLSRVCLTGFRLGGTLALAAAAKRTDSAISDLILWGPLARGKTLCREIGMAQTLHYGKRRSETSEPTMLSRHFFGFLPTATTLEDLERLDVTCIDHRPAQRAWLVQRGDQPIDPALIKRLEELDVAVTIDSVVTDPRVALHPNLPYIGPFAEKVKEWLGSGQHSPSIPTLHASVVDASSLEVSSVVAKAVALQAEHSARAEVLSDLPVSLAVRESTLAFSTEPYLFGIVSEPASPGELKSGQAVLFLTSGASHHIGPGRLYVVAARDLAAKGYTAFRFDLSGIGDSPAAGENNEGRRPPKNAVLQVKLAMDVLAKDRGIEAFTLCGLCSGARLAFAVALADDRVIDIQMINPPSLQLERGPYHLFVQLRHVLGNASKWHRAFKGGWYSKLAKKELAVLLAGGRAFLSEVLRRGLTTLTEIRSSDTAGNTVRSVPAGETAADKSGSDASEVRSQLLRLARRGLKPLFIYSGKDRGISYFNHFVKKTAEELELPVLMYPEADHLFSEPYRDLLLSLIGKHLREVPVSQTGSAVKPSTQPANGRPGSGIHALRDRAAAAVQATASPRPHDRSLGIAKPG